MHRIDGPGAVNNLFTEGDPSVPQMATVVTAAWTNDVQENLCRALEAAGITPTKGDYDQLRQAIGILSGAGFVGEIRLWGAEVLPASGDWLELDGAALLIADYPALYDVCGARFGTAPVGYFRLPDMRGRVPRGWDHGAGRDPEAANRYGGDHVGSTQEDAIKKHDHPMGVSVGLGAGGIDGTDDGSYTANSVHQFTHTSRLGYDANITYAEIAAYNIPIAAETRMKNISLMYIMRWR